MMDSAHRSNDSDPGIAPPRCFVTVGATAGFRQLLEEVGEPSFLATLARLGFDSMDVQCGPDLAWFQAKLASLHDSEKHGVEVSAFDLTDNMQKYMVACRGERGVRLPGCIISHAGTGTILEAMRYAAPLVVVPNPTLMNNHQAELAEECEKQKWAVYGRLGALAKAVQIAHELAIEGPLSNLPPYTPPAFPVPESERVTLFDWMVLTCYPDEFARQQHLLDLYGDQKSPQPQDRREQGNMNLD